MNIYMAHLLLFVSFLTAMFSGEVEAQSATEKTSDSLLMIDNFDAPSDQTYAPFRSVDTVISTLGYGIYYRTAKAKLSLVPLSETDKALRIQYEVPPFFSWGNWLTIRKEVSPLDLSKYDGVEFELKVDVPSNATLRLTLLDVETLKDAKKHGSDELWWGDLPKATLENTQKWVTLRVPFQEFFLSFGDGVRHNDGKLDLSKVIGYEMNLLAESGESPKGTVFINSLRAYKD